MYHHRAVDLTNFQFFSCSVGGICGLWHHSHLQCIVRKPRFKELAELPRCMGFTRNAGYSKRMTWNCKRCAGKGTLVGFWWLMEVTASCVGKSGCNLKLQGKHLWMFDFLYTYIQWSIMSKTGVYSYIYIQYLSVFIMCISTLVWHTHTHDMYLCSVNLPCNLGLFHHGKGLWNHSQFGHGI